MSVLSEYAQFLFDNERYEYANSVLLRIEAIDEKNLFAKNLLFNSYLKLKQYSDALSVGEELLLIDEKNISLIFQLAETSSALNMQEKEMSFYDKALNIEPSNIIALEKKASSLLNKNLIAEALPLFDKLHSLGQTQRLTIIYAGTSKIINKDFKTGIGLLHYSILNESDVHNSRGYLFLAYALCQTNGELDYIERHFKKIRFNDLKSSPFALDEELAAKVILHIITQKINAIQSLNETGKQGINKIIQNYLVSDESYYTKTTFPTLAEAWFVIGLQQKELCLFSDAEYSFQKAFVLNTNEKKYKQHLDEALLIINKYNKKRNIKKAILTSVVLLAIIGIVVGVNIYNKNAEVNEWETAKLHDTINSYNYYLCLYPDDTHTNIARNKIDSIMWSNALKSNTYESYKFYCDNSYNKEYLTKADSLKQLVIWNYALKNNTYETYQRYVDLFPNGRYLEKANNILETKLWSKANKDNIETTYNQYLNRFPNGRYRQIVVNRIKALYYIELHKNDWLIGIWRIKDSEFEIVDSNRLILGSYSTKYTYYGTYSIEDGVIKFKSKTRDEHVVNKTYAVQNGMGRSIVYQDGYSEHNEETLDNSSADIKINYNNHTLEYNGQIYKKK